MGLLGHLAPCGSVPGVFIGVVAECWVNLSWSLEKFKGGMQSQIILARCVLHNMYISTKDQVPERDVGEADAGRDMEEEVEGDEEFRVVGETSNSHREKLAERKFPDHYLKPIHMVVMEGSADDIEKISCGHSRHRSKEIHSL